MWEWLKRWWQREEKERDEPTSDQDWWQLFKSGSERQQQQAALVLLARGELTALEPVLNMLQGRDPLRSLEAMEALLAFPEREEMASILWSRLPLADEQGQSRLLDWACRAGIAERWLIDWLASERPPTAPFCALAASFGDERFWPWLQQYWQQQPGWQRAEAIWRWATRMGGSWPAKAREWLLPWLEQQPDNSLRRSWMMRLKEAE